MMPNQAEIENNKLEFFGSRTTLIFVLMNFSKANTGYYYYYFFTLRKPGMLC